jgi:hypothetical protein
MSLNISTPVMTTELLKMVNKLSEFAFSPAMQENVIDNMYLQCAMPIGNIIRLI